MFTLTKYGDSPIFAPDKDLSWEREGVFNPGVVKIGNEIIMLYRAVGEREAYVSRFGLAKSLDGITFTRVMREPVFGPEKKFDQWAVEDPRITKIGADFYITYVAVPSRILAQGEPVKHFPPLETNTALLKTKDFLTFENLGLISPPNSDNKDIVLFSEKINGQYLMLHRPNRWSKKWFRSEYEKYVNEGLPCPVADLPEVPGIWLAHSSDLTNWIGHKIVMSPTHKMDAKIGPGLPPLLTDEGWLLIYHHVEQGTEPETFIYSARAALLDHDDPSKLIAKLPYDILTADRPYEMSGQSKIVFPTGGFITDDTLSVYYGAGDGVIGLATGSVKALLSELKNTGKVLA